MQKRKLFLVFFIFLYEKDKCILSSKKTPLKDEQCIYIFFNNLKWPAAE